MKSCKICGKNKPFSEYVKQGVYWHPKCNDCRLEYQRNYNRDLSKRKKYKLW